MRRIRLAVVAGEESGDLLGADLVRSLAAESGAEVEIFGVGGRHLAAHGLATLFDTAEISIVGASSVIRELPRIFYRIAQTARAVLAYRPDCFVTIDVPSFSLRVARRVRAANPNIPIVHYVCPSVWAWGPQRARQIRPYVDRVLCLLPFEPAELERLGGPPGEFVGHRLTRDQGLAKALARQTERLRARRSDGQMTLLVLPGSRRAEISGLAGPFGETVALLKQRGHDVRVLLPTVPSMAELVAAQTASWPQQPSIIPDTAGKWRAFAEADAALAASGTVCLELALAGVPFVGCYKADLGFRLARRFITVWSSLLPNLIADYVIAPEYHDNTIRPSRLARHIERLAADTPQRTAQISGFADVRRALSTVRPAGEVAAQAVLAEIGKKVGRVDREKSKPKPD